MIYKFNCSSEDCNFELEVIMPIASATFENRNCPKCGNPSIHKLEAPYVSTSNMINPTVDVAIGKLAAARWEKINSRLEKRNNIRIETNTQGLTATGINDYSPISEDRKQKRTNVMKAVVRDGFKPTYN